MRRIAVINQKGGVGKTTTTANLGYAIARQGFPVALIDLDPQSHLTMHFGIEAGSDISNVYHVFTQQAAIDDVIVDVADRLKLVPSNIDLAAAEFELASVVGREVILRDAVEKYSAPYRFMFIDCPPSLGILTLNALCAADEVFITLQPHFLALQGLGKLLETVNLVASRINHSLKVSGVIVCMYEGGTRLANEVVADLERFFAAARSHTLPWTDAVIFNTRIRRNVKLAEAPSFGMDIIRYAPHSHGAEDYIALAEEIIKGEQYDRSAATEDSRADAVDGQSHDALASADPESAMEQNSPDGVSSHVDQLDSLSRSGTSSGNTGR